MFNINVCRKDDFGCFIAYNALMPAQEISGGTAHPMPADLKKALLADKEALTQWESLTPLARNEWICWVEYVKKAETRKEHIERIPEQLKEGDRRPCCWMGCMHRTDKPLSSTQKWILEKKKAKKEIV